MTEAVNPPLVMVGGVLNLLGGLLNLLVGALYIFLCYGILVVPLALWQIAVGALALTGKRVPSHIVASCVGVFCALITFNFLGIMLSGAAAGILAIEFMAKRD